jgi:hypothetical protein
MSVAFRAQMFSFVTQDMLGPDALSKLESGHVDRQENDEDLKDDPVYQLDPTVEFVPWWCFPKERADEEPNANDFSPTAFVKQKHIVETLKQAYSADPEGLVQQAKENLTPAEANTLRRTLGL